VSPASADPAYRLDVEGPGAPPRSNGELVFSAPWESRAFGLAMALADQGVFEWETFRQALIAQIAAFETAHPDGEGWSYYACWLAALESVLTDGVLTDGVLTDGVLTDGVLSADDVRARVDELAARPAGHDHADGHGDHHHHDHR
jgi:nitrile hydratase accessory protein